MWWDDSPEHSDTGDGFYVRSKRNDPTNPSTAKTTILNTSILDLIENNKLEVALPKEIRTSEEYNDFVFSQSQKSQNFSQTGVLDSSMKSTKGWKRKAGGDNTDLINGEPKKKEKKSDTHDKLLDEKLYSGVKHKKKKKKKRDHGTHEASEKVMKVESATVKQHKKKKKKQKSSGVPLDIPLCDTNDPKTEVTNELFSQFRDAIPVIGQRSLDNLSHSECPSTFSVTTEQLGQMRTHVNSFIGYSNEQENTMQGVKLSQDKGLNIDVDNSAPLEGKLDDSLFKSPENCTIKKKKYQSMPSVPSKLSFNNTEYLNDTSNEGESVKSAMAITEPLDKPRKKKKKNKDIEKVIAVQKCENFNIGIDEFVHNLIEDIQSEDLKKSTEDEVHIDKRLPKLCEKEKKKKHKSDIQFKKEKKSKKHKEPIPTNDISSKIKESKSKKGETKKSKPKDTPSNFNEITVQRKYKRKIKSKAIIDILETDSDDCDERNLNQHLHENSVPLILKDTSNFRNSISKDKLLQRDKKTKKIPEKERKFKSKALIDSSDSEDGKEQVHVIKQKEVDKVKQDLPKKKKKRKSKHSSHKAESSTKKGKKNRITGIADSVTESTSQKSNENDIILKESVDLFISDADNNKKNHECQTPICNGTKNTDNNVDEGNIQQNSINMTKSSVMIDSSESDSDTCLRQDHKLKEKSLDNAEKLKLNEIVSEQIAIEKETNEEHFNTDDRTNFILNSKKTNGDNLILDHFLDGIMDKMLETMKTEEEVDLSTASNAPSQAKLSTKACKTIKPKVKVEKTLIKQEEEDMKFSSEYSDADQQLLKFLNVQIDFNVPVLHTLEKCVTRTPRGSEVQEKIDELGVDVKNGNYSPEEMQIIANNWDKFCKDHCFPPKAELFINPRIFGSERSVLPTRELLKFVRYLANGLPNRLLFSVYNKFKRMYSTVNHGRFTEEEDDIIMSTMNSANCSKIFVRLGLELNRDPNAVEKHYIFLREGGKHDFKEDSINPQDANAIVQKLYKEMNCQNIIDLKNKPFPFSTYVKIGEELQIRPLRIQTWWTFNMHPKLFVTGTRNLTEVRLELIDLILKNSAYKTVDHLNYNDFLPHFDGWTAPALGKLTRNMMRSKDDPNRGKHNFRAVLLQAKDHYASAPPKYLGTATFENGELNVNDP